MSFILTFASVTELNSEVAHYRAEGMTVKVKKTQAGFLATVDEGGKRASATSTPKKPKSESNVSVWFYANSEWQNGADQASYLRSIGKKVSYFKARSAKCWVLKVLS